MNDRQMTIDMIHENNNKYLKELSVRISATKNVIPFVGAGMSCPIYKTWSEYLKSIPLPMDRKSHRNLEKRLKDGQFEEAAQELRDKYGIAFYDRTEECFKEERIQQETVSTAARLLPQLFRSGTVLTTNLDRIIEKVYSAEGISIERVMADNPNLVQALTRDGTACLWKIHGDIGDRGSWVLTQSDYDRQYGLKGELFQAYLRQISQGKIFLFLGCSLENDRIVSVLKDICKENPNIRHYAILPVKNGYRFSQADIRAFTQRHQELGQMGICPVWYPDGEYDSVGIYLQELLHRSETPSPVNNETPFSFGIHENSYIKKKR